MEYSVFIHKWHSNKMQKIWKKEVKAASEDDFRVLEVKRGGEKERKERKKKDFYGFLNSFIDSPFLFLNSLWGGKLEIKIIILKMRWISQNIL